MLPFCNIRLITKKPLPRVYPSKDDNSLGAHLKRKRLNLGWTRMRTSIHLEVSEDTYRNWEWNWFMPDIHNKRKIIDFLGFNFWENKCFSISDKLKTYRMKKSLTQLELANQLGLGKTTIFRIENSCDSVSSEVMRLVKVFTQINE